MSNNYYPLATLYMSDAFDYKDGRLMGRHAAGLSYLRAIAEGDYEAAGFLIPDKMDNDNFIKTFSSLVLKDKTINVELFNYDKLNNSNKYGGLFIHDPQIGNFGLYRSKFGNNSFSIVGITHTTMSLGVINFLSDLYSKPAMEWDALVCTSSSVKSSIMKIIDYQEEFLKDKFEAKKFPKPQFPIIPLGIHSRDFNFTLSQRDEVRKKMGIKENDIALIFVGRLSFHAKAHPFAMYKALDYASKSLKKGQKIRFMSTKVSHTIEKLGIFTPKIMDVDMLGPGEIGFITASVKTVADCKVGDTITDDRNPVETMLPGFKPSVPVVFCGLFPMDNAQFSDLREALSKLSLNDASFSFEAETSAALGFGFRCGFLGLLHMEIIRERLTREFDLELISTAPSVVYKVQKNDNTDVLLHNPADLPDINHINFIEEPWIKATIMVPDEYVGSVLTLCTERRGEQIDLTYAGTRAMIVYKLPLNEVVFDFYDKLKSMTSGYASFDYQIDSYKQGNLVRVSILVNGDPVDALAMISHRDQAESRGRAICTRLKDLIPRQLFKVALQAAIGGKVIARETIAAMRKDVTAKCYGGDISRKKKLLEKQKAGKKRMRQFGSVEIPQNAFFEALKMGDN